MSKSTQRRNGCRFPVARSDYRQAARTLVPLVYLRGRMVMAGRSKADVLAAVKDAFRSGDVPALENGAMDYMMSKSAYLTDYGEHNGAHLMFFQVGVDGSDWGSGAGGSPVMAAPYWFFGAAESSDMDGLRPIVVFLVGVANWSDGTAAS